MGEETCVIQASNVAPTATRDQMKTLFTYIGRIDELKLYPESGVESTTPKVCYIKFHNHEDVGVALHLSNTVFVDRALVVVPVADGNIPDESRAMQLSPATVSASVGGAGKAKPAGLPSHVQNQVIVVNGKQMIQTIDPQLTALGLPPYPLLPGGTDPSKVDEIRRTIFVGNLDSISTPEQLLHFFTQAGEVKYVRMAGDETLPTRFAFVEFSEQASVLKALVLNGSLFSGRPVRVNHSNVAIVKPVGNQGASSNREVEEAMKKVKEAQSLISAVVDEDKPRSRSRSRSRRKRSHSRRRSRSRGHRSRSRGRRSRSRGRSRRSRSRSRRSRSRKKSRSRSRSPRQRSSRSRRRRSRSKSRDRRRRKSRSKSRGRKRSRSKSPADSKRKRSTSRGRKRSRSASKERRRKSRSGSPKPKEGKRSRSRSRKRSKSPQKKSRSPKRTSRSRSPRRSKKKKDRDRSRDRTRSKKKSREDRHSPERATSAEHNSSASPSKESKITRDYDEEEKGFDDGDDKNAKQIPSSEEDEAMPSRPHEEKEDQLGSDSDEDQPFVRRDADTEHMDMDMDSE